MSKICESVLTIKNDLGLHARAATLFVQLASKYNAEIVVSKDGREVNGKSIMGVLTLVAVKGSQIQLRAEGEEAEELIAALADLVERKFMEDH